MPDVQYKPGRIQTLSPEQEIATKQCWGYILKYFGYDLLISTADMALKDAFVSLTTSAGHTLHFAGESAVSASNSRRGGFFSRGSAGKEEPPVDSLKSKRVQKVKAKKTEKYVPVQVNEQHRYTYLTHYALPAEMSRIHDNDATDVSSGELSIDTLATNLTLNDSDDASAPKTSAGGSLNSSYGTKARTSILPLFKQYNPKEIHTEFWKSMRVDLPDNNFLRFIRARNFDVERALTMTTTDLNWRAQEYPCYNYIMEADGPLYNEKKNPGLIKNLEAKKAWIRGRDKEGNVIFMFRAALHFGGDATQEEMRRWCICLIEWTRYCLRDITELRDQALVVFDLTGFSLKNADYTTIKFIADVFEAHYPECLAHIYIYNAPWVFLTFWNIIKNWLDPVVSSKIRFLKDETELFEVISKDQLPTFMGGSDDYMGDYIPPSKTDYQTKPKDATYQKLVKERDELRLAFVERTCRWIELYDPATSLKYLQDKIDVGTKIAANMVALDPYLRMRGPFDRAGFLKVSLFD